MKIYKTRQFAQWAASEHVTDEALVDTVQELERGLRGVSLGANLYKKRVALGNKGKSGGARVILVYLMESRVFYIYGFSKNELENITEKQEKALKSVGKQLIAYDATQLGLAIKQHLLYEVR